jgi:DNA-binding beta-propeller fold protein YncE
MVNWFRKIARVVRKCGWVNEGSGNVTELRAADGHVLGTFSVGNNPYGVAFDGVNIWVANWMSNTISKL